LIPETFNIQHSTPNIQCFTATLVRLALDAECSMLSEMQVDYTAASKIV